MPRLLFQLLSSGLYIFIVILGLTILPESVFADSATIFVDPQSASHTVSDEFNVSLKITSAPSPFNAAQANVAVSSNLTIESVDFGDCNFTFIQTPTTSDPSFIGGITQGSTNSCTVYTLGLKANASGNGTITISNPSVIVVSGNSSVPANVSVQNGSYSISAAPTPTPTPTPTPVPVIIEAVPTPKLTPSPTPSVKPLIRIPKLSFLPPADQIPLTASNSSPAKLKSLPILAYTFEVQVKDQDDNPVSGAHLYLYSQPQETLTDQNGVGKFSNVSPGEHKLYISFNDTTEERSIQISGNSPILVASIKLGSLTNFDLIRRIIAIIGGLMFAGGLSYQLLSRRLKRRIRHFLYFRIIQYLRVRYISLRYVKRVQHHRAHPKRSLKRRVHHFYYYKVLHRLKVKLITLRYIKRIV